MKLITRWILALLLAFAAANPGLAGDWNFLVPPDRDLTSWQKIGASTLPPEVIQVLNLDALQLLDNAPPSAYPGLAPWMTPQEASQSLFTLNTHPVAGPQMMDKYDPNHWGVGFCFGRAMEAHLDVTDRGLAPDSVVKLWAVGPMHTPDGRGWGYHVATAVRSMVPAADGSLQQTWLVIDPVVGQVMNSHDWFNQIKTTDATGNLSLYVTRPERFSPGASEGYTPDVLNSPIYNGYFKDLLKDFDLYDSRSRQIFGPYRSAPPVFTDVKGVPIQVRANPGVNDLMQSNLLFPGGVRTPVIDYNPAVTPAFPVPMQKFALFHEVGHHKNGDFDLQASGERMTPELEYAADSVGLRLALENGLTPRDFEESIFPIITQVGGKGDATHPPGAARVQKLREKLQAHMDCVSQFKRLVGAP